MEGFKTQSINIPEYIDWNSFEIKNMSSSQVIIYIHDLKKDILGDIEKINKLKNMPNLSNITINSNDFNVGIYISELLRDVDATKSFHLLDDFQNKDRSYIDYKKLARGTSLATIPNSYIQWGAKRKQLNLGFCKIENSAVIDRDSADMGKMASEQALEEIQRIIDVFLEIPNLTFVDKVVLVSNYLQQNVQFVEGKVSHAVDGKYICEDYSFEKYGGINSVDNVIFDHIGKCNCISRTMMLMLNNPKMNVNCRIANWREGISGHAYCSVMDNETGELYCIDPTWCISRNPNRFPETLKASQFSDEYLLIGQDKLSTMTHHNTINVLPKPFATTGIDREQIQQSVEKLKSYGIKFEYPRDIPLKSTKVGKRQDDDTSFEL